MSPPPAPPAPPQGPTVLKTLCNFPGFSFTVPIPDLLVLIPIPNFAFKLPFELPPYCPLD